jgi:hypothetical protein
MPKIVINQAHEFRLFDEKNRVSQNSSFIDYRAHNSCYRSLCFTFHFGLMCLLSRVGSLCAGYN